MRKFDPNPKPVTAKRIERALDRVAEIMLARKDGEKLAPMFHRLEKMLDDNRAQEKMLERVDLRAAKRRPKKMDRKFAPGSFGAHEALHATSIVMDLVDQQIMQHPTVGGRPEWLSLAETAHKALFDLYQAIGSEHVATEESPKHHD